MCILLWDTSLKSRTYTFIIIITFKDQKFVFKVNFYEEKLWPTIEGEIGNVLQVKQYKLISIRHIFDNLSTLNSTEQYGVFLQQYDSLRLDWPFEIYRVWINLHYYLWNLSKRNSIITSIKYLGLHFDTKLTWNIHIYKILKKAYARLTQLNPLINRKTH